MVKLIKLITGEETIATIKKNDLTTELTNPVRVIFSQTGASLAPFSLFSKGDTITIKNEHILFETDVEDEVLNGYNAQFGTGIVIAGTGGKLIT